MSTTFFVISVGDECGSFATDTINYEVTSPPLIVTTSAPVEICPGDSTLLQVSASGGFGFKVVFSDG